MPKAQIIFRDFEGVQDLGITILAILGILATDLRDFYFSVFRTEVTQPISRTRLFWGGDFTSDYFRTSDLGRSIREGVCEGSV